MSFSASIKKIRLDAFMSQQEFAKVLGVSFTTVNRWENNKALPRFEAMKAIDAFCQERALISILRKSAKPK